MFKISLNNLFNFQIGIYNCSQINVKMPDGRTVTLNIYPRDTVASLFKRISEYYSVEGLFNITQENMVLDSGCAISDLNQGILFEFTKVEPHEEKLSGSVLLKSGPSRFSFSMKTKFTVGFLVLLALSIGAYAYNANENLVKSL
jgi:hypothetical protein